LFRNLIALQTILARVFAVREKTLTISFRIGETAFKAPQDEAKKNNTSLNTLTNQLFMAYGDHDGFLQRSHDQDFGGREILIEGVSSSVVNRSKCDVPIVK
jgi:hypothetical protein